MISNEVEKQKEIIKLYEGNLNDAQKNAIRMHEKLKLLPELLSLARYSRDCLVNDDNTRKEFDRVIARAESK